MSRFLTAFVTGLLLAGGGGAAESGKVVIRWHGQSFFEIISSRGTRVVTDPHVSLSDVIRQDPDTPPLADLTHQHRAAIRGWIMKMFKEIHRLTHELAAPVRVKSAAATSNQWKSPLKTISAPPLSRAASSCTASSASTLP